MVLMKIPFAFRAYAFLSHVVKEIRSKHCAKPDLVTNGDMSTNNLLWLHANDWRLRCESSIGRPSITRPPVC